MRRPIILARAFVVAAAAFASGAAPAQTAPLYAYQPPAISSGLVGDRYGTSVSHDGEWLAVGAPGYDDGDMIDSGRVGIYRWSGGEWRVAASLQLSGLAGEAAQVSARFGTSVAVSGNRVLIGCPGCRDGRAKAYLVDLQNPLPGTFHKLFPAIISEPDSELGIGSSVALSGSILAIGAPRGRSTLDGGERGAVATGRFDGTAVVWEDILFGPAAPDGSRFGKSLAIAATAGSLPLSGYRSLLIGAPAYVNSGGFGLAGHAYLYQRGNLDSGWDFQQEFDNATPGLADALGSSVAIDRASFDVNGYLVLGAPGRSVGGTPGGGAFIYSRAPGATAYTFEALIQHPAAETGDRFGAAVGIDGARVVVGADGRARNVTHTDQGRAYVFERRVLLGDVGWPGREELFFPGTGNVNLGRALSMSNNLVVLGWPSLTADTGGGAIVYPCDAIFAHGVESNVATRVCAVP